MIAGDRITETCPYPVDRRDLGWPETPPQVPCYFSSSSSSYSSYQPSGPALDWR